MRKQIVCFLFLVACGSHERKKEAPVNFKRSSTVNESSGITGDTCFKPADENESPPFKYPCPCDFQEFGEHMTKDSTLHVYWRGKGFNPHLPSCTFTFYEGVMNVHAGDNNFKVLKVHLLDTANFSVITDGSVYGDNNVKDKVIWIYERHKTYDTTIIDPYKTGIYHE